MPGQSERDAVIVKWDAESDLAVLASKSKYPVLKLSESDPYPGYWVMAFGSADGYAGSVALGNVLNVTGNDILITNNISHGNSGGPLLDNEGNVVGVNTWGSKTEQYNIAVSLDAFCAKILDCQYEYKGEKTWWDYS
jgi:S1-C subfamily serine protease